MAIVKTGPASVSMLTESSSSRIQKKKIRICLGLNGGTLWWKVNVEDNEMGRRQLAMEINTSEWSVTNCKRLADVSKLGGNS